MLLLIAAILATSSFTEASTDCSESRYISCRDFMKTTEFPQTTEEMDAICESALQFLACSIQHEENCGKDENVLDEMNSAKNVLERVCDKDTSLYTAVSDNLVCIKKAIYRIPCDLQSEDELTKFEDKLKEQGLSVTALEEHSSDICMSQLYALACRAAKVGRECGEVARDAVTEIFQEAERSSTSCSEEILNEFPTIVKILQEENLEEEVKESLEE